MEVGHTASHDVQAGFGTGQVFGAETNGRLTLVFSTSADARLRLYAARSYLHCGVPKGFSHQQDSLSSPLYFGLAFTVFQGKA